MVDEYTSKIILYLHFPKFHLQDCNKTKIQCLLYFNDININIFLLLYNLYNIYDKETNYNTWDQVIFKGVQYDNLGMPDT